MIIALERRNIFMAMEDITSRFKFIEMTDEKKQASEKIREEVLNLADITDIYCSDSREKSLALTKLQEFMFWVNACISHN